MVDLDPDIEAWIRKMEAPEGRNLTDAYRARVDAILARNLAASMHELWDGLGDVQRTLGRASDASEKHAAALVRWTKVSVFAVVTYTLLTAVNVWISVAAMSK